MVLEKVYVFRNDFSRINQLSINKLLHSHVNVQQDIPMRFHILSNKSIQISFMKQALRKLKGATLTMTVGDVTLCESFRQDCEFYQLYFATQLDNVICKVYDLETETAQQHFHHEQQVFEKGGYDELVGYLMIAEFQIKKMNCGVLLLKMAQNCFLKQLKTALSYYDLLALIETVLSFIERLRAEKKVFLKLNPWSVGRSSDGEFKLLDAEYLSNEGNYQSLSETQYELLDLCEKEYQYCSPELLDQYSRNKIDYSSDLFSFAIVLYELLYQQYPFQSKLAQVNSNHRPLIEDNFLNQFIGQILRPYSQRASLQTLKGMLQTERKKIPKEVTAKNLSSGSTVQSKGSNLFSGITQMFSKLTTETESWYLNFTENDEQRPEEKYLNLIINKLYKKETKLQKLQSIMLKYIQEADFETKESQLFKTVLLVLQLFRKGPNMMNSKWEEILTAIEGRGSGSPLLLQLCIFCKQKIALNEKVKAVLRGNFYLQELSKFKLITLDMLDCLQKHLVWMLQSINSKFIFIKKDKLVLEYARQIYCDQILDLISMLIFSVLCIRKDNELQFRKDNIESINQLQRKINNFLKKISSLSNHVNAHAIYSLEGEFFYYREEIQLREKPHYTSFEHFYKHMREYKGLAIPQNYALTFTSGDAKEFMSSEDVRGEKSESSKKKIYFQEEDDEEGDSGNASFKEITASPDKVKLNKSLIVEQFKKEINSPPRKEQKKEPMFNLKITKPKKEEEKKTVTFNDFFNMEGMQMNKPIPSKESKDKFQFNFDKTLPETKIKKSDSREDFSFFQVFNQPNKDKKKPVQSSINSFFQNFGVSPKDTKDSKTVKDKNSLGTSNSQRVFTDNIMSYDWLKNATIPSVQTPKPKPTVDPQLLKGILSKLKLKELKQIITNSQDIIIDFAKLKLQKVIGSGSAGQVYLGKYLNEVVAIKKVKTQNPNALKEFERELLTYIKIKRNPYLVSLVGLSISEDNYYLLTEFCNSGSLFDLLHKKANTVALSWKQKIAMALQIAKGMLFLHQMKPPIIHRDLKSLNVFVIQQNGVFSAKVADFGLSRSPESEMMTMYLGTLHWMAPELLDNRQYSIKVDVYSYAVVLWQICARKTPYNQLSTPMAIIKHVTMQKKRPNLSAIPPDCPPELIDIMKQCWSHEPNDRPSLKQVIDRISKMHVFI